MSETPIIDSYLTPKEFTRAEIKVKGSRFLALAGPVTTMGAVDDILRDLRKTHYDATHHCYAFRLGFPGEEESRSNDDGEPSGTAGRPILDALEGRDLFQCLCVVTRYFGGTKLGTGGLLRAYSEAAGGVLDKCRIVRAYRTRRIRLLFDYPMTGRVMSVLSRSGARIAETHYGSRTVLDIDVRLSESGSLCRELVETCAGQIDLEET